MISVQALYQKALTYSATKHTEVNQVIPGTKLPYIVHVSNVAMEILVAAHNTKNFNLELAVRVALLHDTLEDTAATPDELTSLFGEEVRQGVQALTKDYNLPIEQRMEDSIRRIKLQPKEIWAVKLADRITNLQSPPSNWDTNKRVMYQADARTILRELKEGNEYLANRLQSKIEDYRKYI